LLVPPRDEGRVAAALHRMLSEPPLRERLISAGRALATQYSWDRTAALTRNVLLQAAGR
jgi:glycosyltransferase involved in cell wall biosynthesis